jgi:type III secretion protein Q
VKRLSLRTLDRETHAHQRRVRQWAEQGYAVELACPPPQGTYLSFTAQGPQGAWRGVIDGAEWLRHRLPQLLALLPERQHGSAALALFTAMDRPLQLAMPELEYEALLDPLSIPGDQLGSQALVTVRTPHGALWVQTFSPCPLRSPVPPAPWVQHLPLPMRASLGSSRLSADALARATVGDVVVLEQRAQRLWIADRNVGHFTFTQEGLIMDQHTEQPVDTPADDLHEAIATRVEFVLHECSMTLAELSALEAGQVLTLPADAVGQVRLLVNRVPVAVGELVQLDDGLGLELHTLLRGSPDE